MKLVLLLLLINQTCIGALYSVNWTEINITMNGGYKFKASSSDQGYIDLFELTAQGNQIYKIDLKYLQHVQFPDFRDFKIWLGDSRKSIGPFKIEFLFTNYVNSKSVEKGTYKFEMFFQNYLVTEYLITKICDHGINEKVFHQQIRDYIFDEGKKIRELKIENEENIEELH